MISPKEILGREAIYKCCNCGHLQNMRAVAMHWLCNLCYSAKSEFRTTFVCLVDVEARKYFKEQEEETDRIIKELKE